VSTALPVLTRGIALPTAQRVRPCKLRRAAQRHTSPTQPTSGRPGTGCRPRGSVCLGAPPSPPRGAGRTRYAWACQPGGARRSGRCAARRPGAGLQPPPRQGTCSPFAAIPVIRRKAGASRSGLDVEELNVIAPTSTAEDCHVLLCRRKY
jgi:hypothetical protein